MQVHPNPNLSSTSLGPLLDQALTILRPSFALSSTSLRQAFDLSSTSPRTLFDLHTPLYVLMYVGQYYDEARHCDRAFTAQIPYDFNGGEKFTNTVGCP
jgi:hypothetical protein